MNFELKLDVPDADQEAVWLNDRLIEEDIETFDSKVVESEAEAGTMDGGVLTGVLAMVISTAVKEGVSRLFDTIFQHFDGKKAAFELNGECPDSGKKFTMRFDNVNEEGRDKAMIEFNSRYEEFCM